MSSSPQRAAKRPKIAEFSTAVSGPSAAVSGRSAAAAADASSISNPSISEDALLQVMAFVGPRELYRMAFTCKTLRDAVTTPLVVKSAMIQGGGGARDCMKAINDLMARQAIHIPSPLRLLRLVNGKRCEFCNGTQLVHNGSAWRLGVFGCRACLEDRMVAASDPLGDKAWVSDWSEDAYYVVALPHPRVMCWRDRVKEFKNKKRAHLWKEGAAAAGLGEAIGPLISFEELKLFLATAKECADKVTSENFDLYIDKELKVPPAEAYKEFVELYAEIKDRSENVVAEREEKKRATAQKKNESRRAKVTKMIEDMQILLDKPFRNAALMSANMPIGRACVKFSSPFVEKLLYPYVYSPSKMRKKILEETANSINENFRLIRSKRFLSMDCFSGDDPFEIAVKRCFGGKYSSYDALVKTGRLDDRFFDLIRKDRVGAALAYFEATNFDKLLVPSDAKVCDKPRLNDLAFIVWKKTLDDSDDNDDDDCFTRVFDAASTTFADALRAIDGYTSWLEEKHPDMDDERKEYAIDEAHGCSSTLVNLLGGNFEPVHDCHERSHSYNVCVIS